MSDLHSLPGWLRVLRSEQVLWPLGFLLAIVGHGASHGIVEAFAGHPPAYWWAWAAAFVTLTLVFYFLYRNPLVELAPGSKRWLVFAREGLPWLLGAGAGVATFGVAASTQRLGTGHPVAWIPATGYVIVLIVLGWSLYRTRTQFLVVHTRALHQEEITNGTKPGHHRSHVIWLLSTITKGLEATQGVPKCLPRNADAGSQNIDLELAAVKAAGEQWNWEMLVRAVRPHTRSGNKVTLTLLCSRESVRQAAWAAALLRRYTEFSAVSVRVWAIAIHAGVRRFRMADPSDPILLDEAQCDGIGFNRVDDLSLALTELLRHIRTIDGARPEDITIDITGGQKPATLVAGAVTFRSESKAQYVETGDDKPVIEYDVVIDPEPRGA